MNLKKMKSVVSIIIAVYMLAGLIPTTFAAQSNEYVDPADNWLKANGRTNEFDINATTTYETQFCHVCKKETSVLTYRVPEFTKSGSTALNHGVKYSDGMNEEGTSMGNLDAGTPGVDSVYTGYHWSKSVCQTCGTINSIELAEAYNFNKNIYALNPCDHNFFLDFDNTTYEPYNDGYHTTTLKRGEYCQFCKGTYAKASQKRELHDFTENIDGQLGNNRFYVAESCGDCDYHTSKYVTAKSVVSAYYGFADGEAHTVMVSDLSEYGVKSSVRYGTAADNCNQTSAPNYTKPGYYTIYYKITYSYSGESMTENGVSYVWLLADSSSDNNNGNTDIHIHDFRYLETVKAACDNLGYERWQCEGCGKLEKRNYTPAHGHSYEEITIREASCIQGGMILSLCKNCGDFHQTTTPTIAHSYKTQIQKPTCRQVGFTEHMCEVCGDNFITDITPLISHSHERVTKAPTCIDKGYTTSTCTMCGLNYVSDYTEPTGHEWDEGHSVTSSTCESEGVIEFNCLHCSEKIIKAESAIGHTPGKAATCTEPQVCTVCNTVLELPKGHKYNGTIISPSCTAMGYTIFKCTDCGDGYMSEFTDKAEHDYSSKITPPTCTAMGFTEYECTACGDTFTADYTDMLPHSYKTETRLPTCAEFGFTTFTCEACGENYVGNYTDKTEHNYSQQIIPPTCTEHGYTIYKCPDCGKEYIGDLTECQQHTYKEIVTPPTCAEMGFSTFICEVCGDTYKAEYKEPNGHSPSDWIIDVPATIEQGGSKHVECSVCGETLQSAEIPQLADKDNSDEDGKAQLGVYSIILTDKDKPIFNSEITIDINDRVTIKLPEGRLLDFADQTTITAFFTDTQVPASELQIFIFDKNNNAATGATDENGQLKVPNSQSGTGDDNGTIGGGDEETKFTYVVTVMNKNHIIIADCNISIGESNDIVVYLPSGLILTQDSPAIITVKDQNGNPQKEITVIIVGDKNYIEKGITDVNGQVTVPPVNSGYTDNNGKVAIKEYIVYVENERAKIANALVTLNEDNTISVMLPDGCLIDYKNRTTVTVTNKDGIGVKDINITVSDIAKYTITDTTNQDGKITVPPLDFDYTDKDGNASVNKYSVVVENATEKIENAYVEIKDDKISVKLPDTYTLITSNQTTVTVCDKDSKAVQGVFVTVTDKNNKNASKTTDINGKITVPVKTSGGGSGGGSSSGGGGDGYISNTVNVKVTDKNGKNVSVTKSIDSKGKVTLSLPAGKIIDSDNWYKIVATDSKGAAKADTTITLNDRKSGTATGTTDKSGELILPASEHKSYIVGYPDGTFSADGNMTRAEVSAIFARLLSDKKDEKISGTKTAFTDVKSNEWYAIYISYLEKYNIIKGYSDKTFRPDAPVTRTEFVTMTVRYYSLFEDVKYPANTTKYTDVNASYWGIKDISFATSLKWLNGYADKSFRPDNNITRAEVVTVVNHANNRAADENYINKNLSALNKFTDLKNNSYWAFYDIMEAANTHMAISGSGGETWVN